MKTRVAVVGSGFGLYGLLPAFQQIPDCSVVGICGKNSARLLEYCGQTGVPVFRDWKTMLDSCSPDAVAVAVVPAHQYEIISRALDRGHSVFAEKPLTVDLAQAAELLAQARAKKAAHMVDFLFPEIPQWRITKKLLDRGDIGHVNRLEVKWEFLSHDLKNNIQGWKSDPAQGGGALSFYFSHVFYNLEFFLGKIDHLRCLLRRPLENFPGIETGVELEVRFANGCVGKIEFDCATPTGHQHFWRFWGETGSLELAKSGESFTRDFQVFLSRAPHEKKFIVVDCLPPAVGEDDRVPWVKALARRFLDWQQGKGPGRPDFSDGLRVQHLIDLSRHSFARKISLPA